MFYTNVDNLLQAYGIDKSSFYDYLKMTAYEYEEPKASLSMQPLEVERRIQKLLGVSVYDLYTKEIDTSEVPNVGDKIDCKDLAFFNSVMMNYIRMDKIRDNSLYNPNHISKFHK